MLKVLNILKINNLYYKNYKILQILKHTIAAKERKRGAMPILSEQFTALFHASDTDRISLAESSTINAITASTPNSGRPVGVVKEITLAAADDDAALDVTMPEELARVFEAAEETVVVLAAVVLDITVVSISLPHPPFFAQLLIVS